jgi:hypothetical protein
MAGVFSNVILVVIRDDGIVEKMQLILILLM